MKYYNCRSKDETTVAPGGAATRMCDLQVRIVTPRFLGGRKSRAQIRDNTAEPWGQPLLSRDRSSGMDLAATQLPARLFYQYLSCSFFFCLFPIQLTENQKKIPKTQIRNILPLSPSRIFIFFPTESPASSIDGFGNAPGCVLLGACLGAADIDPVYY